MNSKFALLVFGSTLLLNLTIIAQNRGEEKSPDSLKIYESKEEVVVGTRPSKEITSLLPYQELRSSEFMRFSPQSISDAIRFMRGVFLRDYGGIGGIKTISLRGLSSNHTLVLYDGIPFTENQTGQIDLGRLSVQSVSSISLIQAGNESLNAPATSLPVSNILSLESAFIEEGTPYSTARVQLLYGAFGEKRFGGELRRNLKEIGQVTFSSEYVSADGRFRYQAENDKSFERQNSDIESIRFEAKLINDISNSPDASEFDATAFAFISERGLPNASIIGNEENSVQRLKNTDVFLQVTHSQPLFSSIKLKLYGKAEFHHTRFIDPNALTLQGIDDRYDLIGFYGGSSLSKILVSKKDDFNLEGSLSADWLENMLSTTLPEFSKVNRSIATFGINLRGLLNSFEMRSSLAFQSLNDRNADNQLGNSKSNLFQSFAYSASAGVNIPATSIKANLTYSKSLRLPSLNERYYTRVGNPNLRPEIARQMNLGLRVFGTFEALKLSFETYMDGYLISSDDKIISVPRDAFNWSVQNVGKSISSGVELGVRLNSSFFRQVESTIDFNYSYQAVTDKTVNSPTFNSQLPYIPFNNFNCRVFLKYQQVSFHTSISQSGFRFSLPENSQANFLPPFSLVDFTLSYEFEASYLKHKVSADLRNVFSENYVIIRSFPMPPRNARIIYELSF